MIEQTYQIRRFYENRDSEIVESGLTLAEAKAHCEDPDTSGICDDGTKWFDGFERE